MLVLFRSGSSSTARMSEAFVTGAEAFETAGRKASPAPGKHRQKLRRAARHRNGGRMPRIRKANGAWRDGKHGRADRRLGKADAELAAEGGGGPGDVLHLQQDHGKGLAWQRRNSEGGGQRCDGQCEQGPGRSPGTRRKSSKQPIRRSPKNICAWVSLMTLLERVGFFPRGYPFRFKQLLGIRP